MPQAQFELLYAEIPRLGHFLLLAAGLATAVRLVLVALQTYATAHTHRSCKVLPTARRLFIGLPAEVPENQHRGDYLTPWVLGFLELVAFPPLMATGHWSYVGAWIAFKTAAQYKHWSDDRFIFNRFLIGNALIVILAYWFLVGLVQAKVVSPAA